MVAPVTAPVVERIINHQSTTLQLAPQLKRKPRVHAGQSILMGLVVILD